MLLHILENEVRILQRTGLITFHRIVDYLCTFVDEREITSSKGVIRNYFLTNIDCDR